MLLGIVTQDLPDFPNRAIDAVVGIQVVTLPPDPLRDLLPADELSPMLRQEKEYLHGDTLQLERAARAEQLICSRIQLEVVAEVDRFRDLRGIGSHATASVGASGGNRSRPTHRRLECRYVPLSQKE